MNSEWIVHTRNKIIKTSTYEKWQLGWCPVIDNQYNMMLFQYCLQYNKMNGLCRELRLYVTHFDCKLISLNYHFSNGKTIHMKVLYKLEVSHKSKCWKPSQPSKNKTNKTTPQMCLVVTGSKSEPSQVVVLSRSREPERGLRQEGSQEQEGAHEKVQHGVILYCWKSSISPASRTF